MPEGKPKFQQQEATNPGEFPHTVTPEGNIYDKTSLEEAAAQGKLTPIDAFVDDDGRIHINPLQYAPADAKYRESVPNNSPTGQSEQYSRIPNKAPKPLIPEVQTWSRNKKVGAAIAGVVLAGAAIFGGSVAKDAMTKKGVEYILEDQHGVNLNDENVIESDGVLDPAKLSVEEFRVLPFAEQLNYCVPIIRDRTPSAVNEIQTLLQEQGRRPLGPVVEPSITNTAQNINDQMTVSSYIASTSQDIEQGKKIAHCQTERESSNVDNIGNGGGAILSVSNVLFESQTFSQTKVGGFDPQGIPTKISTEFNTKTNDVEKDMIQVIYQLKSGELNGGNAAWVIEDVIAPSDKRWIDDPSSINVR